MEGIEFGFRVFEWNKAPGEAAPGSDAASGSRYFSDAVTQGQPQRLSLQSHPSHSQVASHEHTGVHEQVFSEISAASGVICCVYIEHLVLGLTRC